MRRRKELSREQNKTKNENEICLVPLVPTVACMCVYARVHVLYRDNVWMCTCSMHMYSVQSWLFFLKCTLRIIDKLTAAAARCCCMHTLENRSQCRENSILYRLRFASWRAACLETSWVRFVHRQLNYILQLPKNSSKTIWAARLNRVNTEHDISVRLILHSL